MRRATARPHLQIAMPVMDELEWLPRSVDSLARQTGASFTLWVCVNQPEAWWGDPARRPVCESNQRCLEWLQARAPLRARLIDRASPGHGWPDARQGVGWARKTLMDAIAGDGGADDIIVSADADTIYPPGYLAAVADAFTARDDRVGLAAPYLHELTGDEALDRATLRYEIYLRYYALNLWRIASPYAFTAMGSLISAPVRCYRAVGGMTPRSGGEDFYFLLKLRKYGRLLHWIPVAARPAARLSERVPIGTGPALARGLREGWGRYPIHEPALFDDVAATMAAFEMLHTREVPTPMSEFLQRQLKTESPWHALRANHKDRERFVRACHERVDGLRILQYLKWAGGGRAGSDEMHMRQFLRRVYGTDAEVPTLFRDREDWTFAGCAIGELDALRLFMRRAEENFRRRDAEDRALTGTP